MRYSKFALLLFGAGLVLGLAVVSAQLQGLFRVASLAMAVGIVLLPLAFVADWRRKLAGAVPRRKKAAATPKRRPAPSRRRAPRKRR
jgi:hypothetical protein